MENSTGPTYTRLRCCRKGSCMKIESMWDAGECYTGDGKLVRDCSRCK